MTDDGVVVLDRLELVLIEQLLRGAGRDEQADGCAAAGGHARPEHGHQRHEAAASSDEQQWASVRGLPHEVAADGSAQLQPVADHELVDQVGRHLAVRDALDGEAHAAAVRGRGDRVAALRLVAVLRGQPDIDVLAGQMTWPLGHIEHEAAGPGRLGDQVDDPGDLPAQSPA